MKENNKSLNKAKKTLGKNNQISKRNSPSLENSYTSNKENPNQGNFGNGKSGQMNKNYRCKHNQENARLRRENLRCYRYNRGNRFIDQRKW